MAEGVAVALGVADAVVVADAVALAVAVALGVVSVVVVEADVAGTTGSVGFGSLHPAIIIADDMSTAAPAASADGRPAEPTQKGQSLAART